VPVLAAVHLQTACILGSHVLQLAMTGNMIACGAERVTRESHKGHLKADFLTSYIIAEHVVFSYHFLSSCNYS
jgi:hypothetical protein